MVNTTKFRELWFVFLLTPLVLTGWVDSRKVWLSLKRDADIVNVEDEIPELFSVVHHVD
jgi:hypothetical protein